MSEDATIFAVATEPRRCPATVAPDDENRCVRSRHRQGVVCCRTHSVGYTQAFLAPAISLDQSLYHSACRLGRRYNAGPIVCANPREGIWGKQALLPQLNASHRAFGSCPDPGYDIFRSVAFPILSSHFACGSRRRTSVTAQSPDRRTLWLCSRLLAII